MSPKTIGRDSTATARSKAITDVSFRSEADPRAKGASDLLRRSTKRINEMMSALSSSGIRRDQWVVYCREDGVGAGTRDTLREADPDLYYFVFGEGAQVGRVPIVVAISEGPGDRGFFAVIWVDVVEASSGTPSRRR